MSAKRAIGQTIEYCLLCLAVETLIPQLFVLALEMVASCGWIASVAQAYQSSAAYLTLVVRIAPALFLALFFKLKQRDPVEELHLRPCTWTAGGYAVVMGIVTCLAASYLLTVIPFPEAWQTEYSEQSAQVLERATPIATAVSTVILAPIAEEIVFRGVLYGRLKQGVPRVVAALVSATLFGMAHGTAIWFVYTFLLGLVLVLLFERTNSLLPSMLCHITFNLFGQINLFPNGTPLMVIMFVYALGMPLTMVVLWMFLRSRRLAVYEESE